MPRRRATTKDVARLAGVSQATVSNVLNHPERVRPAVQEAVTRAIADLGFVRHEGARQLRSGHSRTLGLLLLDAWNPAFQEIARGVEETTHNSGWNLLIANSARTLQRESAYLRVFAEARVPGLIVIPHDEQADTLHRVRAGGAAVVVVDRAEQGENTLSVAVDDVAGGRMAADHLIALGHRHILFVGDASTATPVHQRLAGVRESVAETHGEVELSTVAVALTPEGGHAAGEQIVAADRGTRPTAVLAAIDAVAFGVVQSLLHHGVAVPQEVSVMGYDDVPLSRLLSVPLTTVRRPHFDMGVGAATLLLDAMAQDRPASRHLVFEPTLVRRASTAAPRGRR
jgi:LacI family transcriptional regulator